LSPAQSTYSALPAIALAALAFLLAATAPVLGEFYRYVDENGCVHYVDDISRVPEGTVGDVDRIREKYDHLPLPERQMRKEEESKRRNQAMDELRRRSMETRVAVVGNSVIVPVSLYCEGRKVSANLVLDTGAEAVVIHSAVADKLGFTDLRPTTIRVADGKTVRAKLGLLDKVEVGPHSKWNLHVLVVENQGDFSHYEGLLGMNFLKGLDYTVDFRHKVIRWR